MHPVSFRCRLFPVLLMLLRASFLTSRSALALAAEPPSDSWDGPLADAWMAARSATEAYHADAHLPAGDALFQGMIGSWSAFAELAEACRLEGREYTADTFDVIRLRMPLVIARAVDTARPRLEAALVERLGGGARAPILANLERAETWYRTFLDQFEATGPPSEAFAHERASATYGLGAVLLDAGAVLASGEQDRAARRVWTEARARLEAELARRLGHEVIDAARGPAPPGDPWLHNLADLWLRAVRRTATAEEYVAAAEAAFAWLPRIEDHVVIIALRTTAQEWAATGAHPAEASRLCGLVRRAHREWWEGRHAHLRDNVAAHFTEIRIAVEFGDHERAAQLVDAMAAIDGLSEWNRDRVAELQRLVAREANLDLFDGIVTLLSGSTDADTGAGAGAGGSAARAAISPGRRSVDATRRSGPPAPPRVTGFGGERAGTAIEAGAAGGRPRGRGAGGRVAAAGLMLTAMVLLAAAARRWGGSVPA